MTTTKNSTSDLATRKRIARREYKRLRNIRNWTKGEDGTFEISVGDGRYRRWYQLFKRGDKFGRMNAGEWVMRSGDIKFAGPGNGKKPKKWQEWFTHSGSAPTLKRATQQVAATDLGMWGDATPYHLDRDSSDEICTELWPGGRAGMNP